MQKLLLGKGGNRYDIHLIQTPVKRYTGGAIHTLCT